MNYPMQVVFCAKWKAYICESYEKKNAFKTLQAKANYIFSTLRLLR